MLRMVLSAKRLDCRVDLHRRNRIDSVCQRDSDIRSGPCAEDQRMVERPAEYAVHELVERLLVLPGVHRLMAPGVVHINNIAIRDSRVEQDFIVRGPVSSALEPSNNNETREE